MLSKDRGWFSLQLRVILHTRKFGASVSRWKFYPISHPPMPNCFDNPESSCDALSVTYHIEATQLIA